MDVPGTVSRTRAAPRRALEESTLGDQTWTRAEAEAKDRMAQRRIARMEEGDGVWREEGDSGRKDVGNGQRVEGIERGRAYRVKGRAYRVERRA
jgi:hypothetical protein